MDDNCLTPANIEDMTRSSFQPDILADHEYLEIYRRKSHLEPEKDLLFAVLEDAVRCYKAYASARSPAARRHFRDAEKWLWKNDWEWPLSFRNICEVLGLNPFYLRRGLLLWKEGYIAGSLKKGRVFSLPARRLSRVAARLRA